MEEIEETPLQDPAEAWEERYNALCEWKDKHGTCLVPKAAGLLGRWTSRQRELQKKGTLSGVRFEKLNAIGFVWDANELAFQERFQDLLEFRRQYGHPCVPSTHPGLGMWVAKLRGRYRQNKLSSERVEKLNGIGFVWSPVDEDWMDNYNRLVDFRRARGHCCVSPRDSELERLGWWCNTQRQNYRKQKLTAHRIELLNRLGFTWNPQHSTNYQVREHESELDAEPQRKRPRVHEALDSDMSSESVSEYNWDPYARSSTPTNASLAHPTHRLRNIAATQRGSLTNLLADVLQDARISCSCHEKPAAATDWIPPIETLFDIVRSRNVRSRTDWSL